MPSSSSSTSRADWEYVLGILLCLGGAASTNLGLTIQKLSFVRNDSSSPSAQRPAIRQPLWLIGLAIFLSGQILNLLAFGYTSQALAATLGSFSLVTNGVYAKMILDERLTKTILMSIVTIILGSILVVMNSSHIAQDYSLNELITLFLRPLFILYFAILSLALLICFIYMFQERRKNRQEEEELNIWLSKQEMKGLEYDPSNVSVNGSINGLGRTGKKDIENALEVDPEMRGKGMTTTSFSANESSYLLGSHPLSPPLSLRITPLSPIVPIIAGAILSSFSVLFGKCSMQLVKTSWLSDESGHNDSSDEFTHPLSWIITIVFLICATSAVVFLNMGLHRGSALFVVPLYYVLNTILAILGGLIYFEEFARFTALQGVMFCVGVSITIVGVYVGSRGQMREEEEDDNDEAVHIDGVSDEGEEDGLLLHLPPAFSPADDVTISRTDFLTSPTDTAKRNPFSHDSNPVVENDVVATEKSKKNTIAPIQVKPSAAAAAAAALTSVGDSTPNTTTNSGTSTPSNPKRGSLTNAKHHTAHKSSKSVRFGIATLEPHIISALNRTMRAESVDEMKMQRNVSAPAAVTTPIDVADGTALQINTESPNGTPPSSTTLNPSSKSPLRPAARLNRASSTSDVGAAGIELVDDEEDGGAEKENGSEKNGDATKNAANAANAAATAASSSTSASRNSSTSSSNYGSSDTHQRSVSFSASSPIRALLSSHSHSTTTSPHHSLSNPNATRRLDLTHLTEEQRKSVRARHDALAAVAIRRKKYSYQSSAYQSSFSAGQGDGERRPGDRRYSVAVLGLGIS